MRAFLLMLSLVLVGCIESSVALQEDNDTITCDSQSVPCDVQIIDSPLPRDACSEAGVTNMLVGTCWWEQCVKGERSLYPKIAGVPCVYKPESGNSPWAEGTCDDSGVCGK